MPDPKTHEPLLPTPDPRREEPRPRPQNLRLKTSDGLAGIRLSSASGLEARITRAGALFSFRFGETLINQTLPGPAEDGMSRIVLRVRRPGSSDWGRLTGAGIAHRQRGPRAMEWNPSPVDGIRCRATLALHENTAHRQHELSQRLRDSHINKSSTGSIDPKSCRAAAPRIPG
jgi:hypothetical protein